MEKEERQKQANLKKLKDETKKSVVEVPPQYREAKAANDKLKDEVDKLNDKYAIEKEKESNLVPPSVIQNYQ